MKNYLLRPFIKSILFFSIIYVFNSCNSGNDKASLNTEETNSCVMDFTFEDNIPLGPHVLDTTSAQMEISIFPNIVSTWVNSALPLMIDSIKSDGFCALKDSADAMHARDPGCTEYLTALRICYGLSTDFTKVVALYQPVYLCNIGSIGGKTNYSLKRGLGNYYSYDPTSESFSRTTDSTCLERYKDSILIVHKVGESRSHFRNPPANDTLGDVNSIVFTFREIAAVINDNNATPYVKVWNAIQELTIVSVGETLNKHAIVLGPKQLRIPLKPFTSPCGSGLFCNKFANLGHLCPPSCITMSF